MNRLFTFGCSFTDFHWPTWADIAGRSFDIFENWGVGGGGNQLIFYSLNEAIQRKNIGSQDTVAIMWTSISREDRWRQQQGWLAGGSVYGGAYYDQSFIEKYADPTGYLIRDLATIAGTKLLLDGIGCQYYFFSIVPFDYHDDKDDDPDCFFVPDSEVIELYQTVVDNIKPSVFETVFDNDWYSRPGQVSLPNLQQRYLRCAGPDWPSWEDFLINRTSNAKDNIRKEIQNEFKLERELIRTDPHPTPAEHLEYLQSQWPDLLITADTLRWVQEVNRLVMLDQPLDSHWVAKHPKRF